MIGLIISFACAVCAPLQVPASPGSSVSSLTIVTAMSSSDSGPRLVPRVTVNKVAPTMQSVLYSANLVYSAHIQVSPPPKSFSLHEGEKQNEYRLRHCSARKVAYQLYVCVPTSRAQTSLVWPFENHAEAACWHLFQALFCNS